ncbi:MAG: recombinase family protein, partial [Desulfovibrio sp.]|nr:recombinase family protein [Desulfovibrio sp.]
MAEKSTTTVPCGGATFVGYYRVSTPRQAASGLGFDAQREAVQKFVSGLNGRLEAEYWEVASGADAGRSELARALEHCRRAGAVLAVSCIDRLARSVAVYVSVWKSGVSFVACDKPEAGDLEVYADVVKAGEERRLVSAR